MDNKGFEVKLNGKLLTKAGLQNNHGVLSCILDATFRKTDKKQELWLNVSGLNSDTNQYTKWIISEELEEDDIVSIKIINGPFDKPSKLVERKAKERTLKEKLKVYHQLKEELKDHLEE